MNEKDKHPDCGALWESPEDVQEEIPPSMPTRDSFGEYDPGIDTFVEPSGPDTESVDWGEEAGGEDVQPRIPLRSGTAKKRRLVRKGDQPAMELTAAQRLLMLDTWRRSQLPAGDFAALVGVSKHSLYAWKKRFDEERGRRGYRTIREGRNRGAGCRK